MSYDVLSGVKVIELSLYAFAPSAGAVLRDWGAEVTKIVLPIDGDPMMGRAVAGLPDIDIGVGIFWEQLNRGKKCIGLDVSQESGREVLVRLLADADVFIINLLPGAKARFRLDVDDIHAINPRLIYARATGHGPLGPEAERGGFDTSDFWARSGLAYAASSIADGFIQQPGPAMGDLMSGVSMAGSIAAALFRRERTGRGAVVDVSLLSTAIWAMGGSIVHSLAYDLDMLPRFSHADSLNPLVTAYRTRDGRMIYLSGVRSGKNFARLAEILGHPEWASDPRFADYKAQAAHARELIGLLDDAFAQHDLADLVEQLETLPIPWAVVQSATEAAHDRQVVANSFVVPVEGEARSYSLVASPAQFDGRAPKLDRAPGHGEHTEQILLELGYDWQELENLKRENVIN